MSSITTGDLIAAMDVIDRLAEESDTLPLDRAVAAMEALAQLASVLRRAQHLVETQVYELLEQPRVIAGRRYKRANVYAKRYDHNRIAHMVADRVKVDRETGEIVTAQAAVAQALHMFVQIYCSDSTAAKQQVLRRLLGVGDVIEEGIAREVRTGTTVAAYDIEEGQ